MANKQLFAKKSLERLLEEMEGDNRLRRVLGPVSLTSLGVGAIIGAGIFAATGRVAAQDAGPAVIFSYVIAGLGCAFAAMCYAELAAMVPVAGSAYTYTYATLGELFAWIVGWDLVLEYAMSCSVVAASWSGHFRELLQITFGFEFPKWLMTDPFTLHQATGQWWGLNLPAVLIMAAVTAVLVLGIRESARTNNTLVFIKLGVVAFVIVIGSRYANWSNWHAVPTSDRLMPGADAIPDLVAKAVEQSEGLKGPAAEPRIQLLSRQVLALARMDREREDCKRLQERGRLSAEDAARRIEETTERLRPEFPESEEDRKIADRVLVEVRGVAEAKRTEKWGIIGLVGLDRWLVPIDDAARSPFVPYGMSGVMLGAAIVFFSYIGFDSISTHSEEAIRPQRDVPIGILASLSICTVLYIIVSGIIVALVPYPNISIDAAIAAAFRELAEREASGPLRAAAFLIALGALAGMTSVLLVTFLSQARIFLAMARDGLLPANIFAAIHPRFRTPHRATMVTGAIVCALAAVTPIEDLENMVNIGTLMAFVMVCCAVLVLRRTRPDAKRPFRCPWVHLLAPLGIAFNFGMSLFLDWKTWLRLVVWLVIGLVIYLTYGRHHSVLGKSLEGEIAKPGRPTTGTKLDEMRQV